jgi:hypothetical protein
MKQIVAMAALAFVAGCAAQSSEQATEMRADSEAKLAAELRNYEQSGPPVSCVSQRDLGGNRSAGDDAIIFSGRTRSMLYVNRPAAGCSSLDFGRALIIRTSGSQLCRGEIVTVYDPISRTEFGGCGLGDFTPYKRIGSRS